MNTGNLALTNLFGNTNTSNLLQNVLNNKLAATMYQTMATQQRESRAMPDSTRRAFLSRMETDARVSRQSAQNLGDASGMLTVAQTGVTGVKHTLTEMRKLALEIKGGSNLSDDDYAAYTSQLHAYAKNLVSTTKGIEFNGFKLLDGSNPTFKLQAGNMQIDADMTNMLDKSLTGDKVMSDNNKSINLGNLAAEYDVTVSDGMGGTTTTKTTNLTITDAASAEKVLEMLEGLIDFTARVESQFSNDIKGVNNLATLLESQADTFDAVKNYHITTPDDNTDNNGGGETPDSMVMLDALVNASSSNGNIISGQS